MAKTWTRGDLRPGDKYQIEQVTARVSESGGAVLDFTDRSKVKLGVAEVLAVADRGDEVYVRCRGQYEGEPAWEFDWQLPKAQVMDLPILHKEPT
jgi:hypothetical protein